MPPFGQRLRGTRREGVIEFFRSFAKDQYTDNIRLAVRALSKTLSDMAADISEMDAAKNTLTLL
jgi:hypothetical protein